jgi:hypothetical protein
LKSLPLNGKSLQDGRTRVRCLGDVFRGEAEGKKGVPWNATTSLVDEIFALVSTNKGAGKGELQL